jgi:mRNA-degrading endonuclease RelE of RelBE toxin-antitoxin system
LSYTVRLARSANAYLRRLPPPLQARISQRIDQIAEDPFSVSKPLRATEGARSARVGDYRIIFDVDIATQTVFVTDIGPRGQIYRGL